MKTLDEVIKMAEHCWQPMPDSICATCPSEQRAGDCHLYANVLRYLKDYRDNLDDIVCKRQALEEKRDYYVQLLQKMQQLNTATAPWNTERNRYCCTACGAYVGKFDKFCPGCGARLTDWTEAGRKAK